MKGSSQALQGLQQAIVETPADEAAYLILADWLEEHDDPRRAELLRLHRKLLATCCEPEHHPERATWQARSVELLAEGVKPCVPERTVQLSEGIEMAFSFIPPGNFLMGRPIGKEGEDDEVPQHRVPLTKGFFLGVHPMTRAQWQAVMGSNPSNFKGDNRPVENVSWENCQEFCQKLSERDGKKYRLPTEAEWEYACRAGTTTEYCSGNGLAALRRVGWFSHDGNWRGKETQPVGQLQPSAWGLFDMHGNVWEWCLDRKRTYASRSITNPLGPQGEEDDCVMRGGDWASGASDCRSSDRGRNVPADYDGVHGCRVVLRLD